VFFCLEDSENFTPVFPNLEAPEKKADFFPPMPSKWILIFISNVQKKSHSHFLTIFLNFINFFWVELLNLVSSQDNYWILYFYSTSIMNNSSTSNHHDFDRYIEHLLQGNKLNETEILYLCEKVLYTHKLFFLIFLSGQGSPFSRSKYLLCQLSSHNLWQHQWPIWRPYRAF